MENAGVRVLELNLALSSHNQSVSYQNILSSDWLHVKSFFPPIGPCNYSGIGVTTFNRKVSEKSCEIESRISHITAILRLK